jgi:hypothetical protein
MFNHKDYTDLFIDSPGLYFPASRYGLKVVQADVSPGESYWQVIGIHHLTPDQNRGNRNVFIEALDEQGKRITNPPIWAGWTWEGIQPHERADPVPLDKPGSEPAGTISVGSNQKVSVWIKGRSRASNDTSDRVEGLHTVHPDEPGPNGENWNSIGHHSFYVVWQRVAVVEPEPEPEPEPVEDWRKHFTPNELAIIEELKSYPPNWMLTGLIAKMARVLDGK